MSTRGFFTFRGTNPEDEHHVYKHCDCYPEGPHGGVFAIAGALRYAWPLPRFEPDEFAAAFVCAAKMPFQFKENVNAVIDAIIAQPVSTIYSEDAAARAPFTLALQPNRYLGGIGGGVGLCPSGSWKDVAPSDIAYRYVVYMQKNALMLDVWAVNHRDPSKRHSWTEAILFYGAYADAQAWAMTRYEAAILAKAAPAPRNRLRVVHG